MFSSRLFRSKTRVSVIFCLALASVFGSCEDKWGDDATMAYVIDVIDNGDETCTYVLSSKPKGSNDRKSITTDCGLHAIGEGFWIDKD